MLEAYTTAELSGMERVLSRACTESNELRHRDHRYIHNYLTWARDYRKVQLELARRSSHK